MKLTKRCAALLLALILCLSMLPTNVFAANPVLTVTPAPEFTVYAFTGATTDARNGTKITDNTLDLSQPVYFMTGNNVQMSGLCLWPVEGDELPPATICNSAYNGKIYSDDLLVLSHVSSSSLMAGTILGNDVGYDWDIGQFYANEGLQLQYMAAGDYYPEPGRYRFLMFYSNYCYYSEVYTITDSKSLTANQGVLEASWLADGNVTSVVPYDVDAAQAAFDLSLSLPAEVSGISSVRLLKADYDIFGSDSYYWFGYNSPTGAFQVGQLVDEGVRGGRHVFTLKGCTIANMSAGCYRVKVIGGNNKHYIDNTVTVVREVSNDPPVITTASLPDGKADVPYYARLDATPVQDGTITWSVSSGRLPDGLTLDAATGEISGTPTKDGSFTFYVKASEAGAGFAEKEYTITVAKAELAVSGEPGVWFSNVGEEISAGSAFSFYLSTNRQPDPGETGTATLRYTATNGAAKTVRYELDMSVWYGGYCNGTLPADARSIDGVDFALNGETVLNYPVGRSVAPVLNLSFSGTATSSLYLTVYNSANETVYTRDLYRGLQPQTISTLPAGTYRFVLTGYVNQFGSMSFGEASVTLKNGETSSLTLPVTNHEGVYVQVTGELAGESWSGYSRLEWYADAAGTQKLQAGESRWLLDDETVWVRATPLYSSTITHDASELVRVDRTSGTGSDVYRRVTITMPKKPSATLRLRVQTEQLAGGWTDGYFDGYYTRYGESGQSSTNYIGSRWDMHDGVLTLGELTEGTRITVTGDTGWGSAEYVVTAADVAAGTVDKTLQIPLASGVFRYSLTYTDSWSVLTPYASDYASGIELRKADGTVLPTVRRSEFLLLTDPTLVSFGETLTLASWKGERDYPVAYGETQLTVTSDGGRKTGTARVDLIQRSYFYINCTRGAELPTVSAIIYNADGTIAWQSRTAWQSGYSTRGTIGTVRLPAGYYYIGLAARDYLDSLTPEQYDTATEFAALPYAVMQAATLTGFTYVSTELMAVPSTFYDFQKVNLALSGVSMSKATSEVARVDLTLTPKTGFTYNESRGIELYVVTNQSGLNTTDGFVSTKSLSVNGKPIRLDRWEGNGIIRSDGCILLKLSQAELAEVGGLPLTMSTSFTLAYDQQLEAKAYFRYYVGNELHSDYVGECSESTGSLTLTAPNVVTDGSFTVYGRGPATVNAGNPYVVTIYLDGKPIASGTTDYRKGYYRIHLDLGEDQLHPMQTLHFTASGAFTGGVRAYSSEQQSTLYNPEGAQLQTFTLNWESHGGDFEAGRGQSILVLNDGDAPNLYGSWYRGENSSIVQANNAKVFWHVTFDGHPEKVQAARVYVPRNGDTVTLECTKLEDGSWVSEPTCFYGVAPDGAWVEYDCPVEYGYVNDPDGEITGDDVTAFLSFLSGGGAADEITGSPLGEDVLFFLLNNEEGEQLPVSFSLENLPWDEAELTELRALELDPQTPNLLQYEEGWMSFGEGANEMTLWGTDVIYRYVDHENTDKHLYMEEIYTADFRIVRTWNETTKTKQISILSIGGLNYADPTEGLEYADETLRGIARTMRIQAAWMNFYSLLSDALIQTIEAQDPDAQKSPASRIADVSMLSIAAKRGPSTQEISDAINKLVKTKEQIEQHLDNPFTKIVQDSYNWAHGEEITQQQIRAVKDFLDDNPCLARLYRFWRSGTNEANNPYRVIAEANSVYYKVGVEGIAKILEDAVNSSSYFQGSTQKAVEKLGDALYKGSVERAYSSWKQALYDADIFDQQIENLCHDLYIAARRAENEERGIGGLCNEGINWRRFPRQYYDYNKYFGYGPRSYRVITPPPGPQGRYDPSGYIYEAVPSNRLEGAEVTLWQLDGDYRTKTNDSGEVTSLTGGYAYLIDAEAFGLEPNPQTTGADGRYQWFVPEGWWRVQVTKAGYEPADTGTNGSYGVNAMKNAADGYYYMPVLPEQLDVNIPLVSYAAPEVASVTPNTLGVFVRFTKYMDETTLTKNRFTLLVNGQPTDFTLSFADSEKSSSAKDAPSYARTIQLTYPGMTQGDSVQLVIDNRVTSYAGAAMESRYDSGVLMLKTPEQAKAPAAEPAGGEVLMNTVPQIVCATENAVLHYTLDGSEPTEESPVLNAPLVITEDLTVKLLAARYDLAPSAVTTLQYTVAREIAPPDRVVATINGKRVNDGDTVQAGKLTLSCSTEGAEIWYTTNGVCPCDDETARHRYTEPIDLTPGSYYFRIRALKDGVYSEGLPLHLTVRGENPFEDVIEGKFYYDAVLWAVAHEPQITTGTDETHFKPGNTCTRAQIVAFLWRAKGCPTPKNRNNPFTDVKDSAYYYDAVLWAVENGVTTGTSATKFGPKKDCTRAQVVTFLWRAEGEPKLSGTQNNPFEDVKKDAYYYTAVLWAVENDITTGTGKGKFSPGRACTRGQIVSFLYRDFVR